MVSQKHHTKTKVNLRWVTGIETPEEAAAKAEKKTRRPRVIKDEFEGWAPTRQELQRRPPVEWKPWDQWSTDRWESIEEMRLGFRLVCGGSMVSAFEFGRVRSEPKPFMSRAEQGICRRMLKWRDDIHDAGMRHRVSAIMNAICREDSPGNWNDLGRAVDFHVVICAKEIAKGLLVRKDDDDER
jgi:hypothetical protein